MGWTQSKRDSYSTASIYAGIHFRIGDHTFWPVQRLSRKRHASRLQRRKANHASTRTAKLYDCRRNDISFNEFERICV
jgi:hypothetical protein